MVVDLVAVQPAAAVVLVVLVVVVVPQLGLLQEMVVMEHPVYMLMDQRIQ